MGCSGLHRSHELVECQGQRAIDAELDSCPDRALVNRECAGQNLLSGQESTDICFKCAESMTLDMRGNASSQA